MAEPSPTVTFRNWNTWQSYRSDRGQPPWIKVHRRLAQDPNWVQLSDAQRGQLVAMWILAADRDGKVTADRRLLARMCHMDSEPDLEVFVRLGFIECDANVTPSRRQLDHPEAEAEAETEAETERTNARGSRFNELYQSHPSGPLVIAEQEYHRTLSDCDHDTLLLRWPEYAKRQKSAGLNVPHLANWLKRGGWADTSLDEAQSNGIDWGSSAPDPFSEAEV